MNLGNTSGYALLLRRPRGRWRTYEQYDDEAEFIQVDVRVRERAAERRVDDQEEHAAADSAERRLRSFKPVLDVPSDNLKYRVNRWPLFRDAGMEWTAQSDSDSRKM